MRVRVLGKKVGVKEEGSGLYRNDGMGLSCDDDN